MRKPVIDGQKYQNILQHNITKVPKLYFRLNTNTKGLTFIMIHSACIN